MAHNHGTCSEIVDGISTSHQDLYQQEHAVSCKQHVRLLIGWSLIGFQVLWFCIHQLLNLWRMTINDAFVR